MLKSMIINYAGTLFSQTRRQTNVLQALLTAITSGGLVMVSGGLLIETAILIPVSILVAAVLLPPAFSAIYGANTSGWNSAVLTVFQILLPVLAIIAIAYQFIREITHGV